MNFLQLCQKTAKLSGTVNSDGLPAAVTGQTQLRLIRIVDYTALAYTDIQNIHAEWRWLQGELPAATALTVSGTARYLPATWNIDSRFAEWIAGQDTMSIYLTATGESNENTLRFICWDEYRAKYLRGSQTNNRPIEYAISPANEFCLGPIPDAVYTIRGPYRKSPQTLAVNADTPEMPARYQDMIWRKALMLLHAYDESAFAVASHEIQYLADLENLERDQLPVIEIRAMALA